MYMKQLEIQLTVQFYAIFQNRHLITVLFKWMEYKKMKKLFLKFFDLVHFHNYGHLCILTSRERKREIPC